MGIREDDLLKQINNLTQIVEKQWNEDEKVKLNIPL
jgi:hypothetical protein